MTAHPAASSILIVASSTSAVTKLWDMLESPNTDLVSAATAEEAGLLLGSEHFDIVIINAPLSDGFGSDFAVRLAETTTAAILLLVKAELYEKASELVCPNGVMTLSKPFSRQMLRQTIRLLTVMRARLLRLNAEKDTLQEKFDDMKLVNRAKLLLMERLKMTESEAHRYIEKQAMNTGSRRRQVAENIIRTYED
ncbi:MAG: ANTAR domain-containing protein [Oscillospiraceae bacterium]|nr:ANTAR domain-containing protein [Oscillospiraceae bacterium]